MVKSDGDIPDGWGLIQRINDEIDADGLLEHDAPAATVEQAVRSVGVDDGRREDAREERSGDAADTVDTQIAPEPGVLGRRLATQPGIAHGHVLVGADPSVRQGASGMLHGRIVDRHKQVEATAGIDAADPEFTQGSCLVADPPRHNYRCGNRMA